MRDENVAAAEGVPGLWLAMLQQGGAMFQHHHLALVPEHGLKEGQAKVTQDQGHDGTSYLLDCSLIENKNFG